MARRLRAGWSKSESTYSSCPTHRDLPVGPPEDPEAGHATIRVDGEPDEARQGRRFQIDPVDPVGEDGRPGDGLGPNLTVLRDLRRDRTGGVPLEVGGVDHELLDGSRKPEPHHDPIVALIASAPGLPTVPHPCRLGGPETVGRMGVVEVGGIDDLAPDGGRGEIDGAVGTDFADPGNGVAVQPKPGHAAVGEDVETDQLQPVRGLRGKGGHGVSFQRCLRNQLHPMGDLGVTDPCPLQGETLRVVPGEEGGVHRDLPHPPRNAEGEHAPVVSRLAATTGLPPVHPLAPIGVLALSPHRVGDLEQIGRRGEELVVAGDNPATDPFREEIDHLRASILPRPSTTVPSP